MFAKFSVPVPLSLVMPNAVPEMMPDMVNDFAALMFHVWLALKAMGLAKVTLTVEVDALMPPALVRTPAPVMDMSVSAAVTLMPPQETDDAKVRPAPKDPLGQVAVSADVGDPFAPEPPVHTPAVAPVRSVPVAALVAVAAWAVRLSVSALANATAVLKTARIFVFIFV